MKNLGVHRLFTIRLDGAVEAGAKVEAYPANEGDSPGIIVGEKVGRQGWMAFLKVCLDPSATDWWEGKEVRVTEALLLRMSGGRLHEENHVLYTGMDGSSVAAGAVVRVLFPFHERLTESIDESYRRRNLARGRFVDARLEPFKQGIFLIGIGEILPLVSLATGQQEVLSYTFDGTQLFRK